MKRATKIWLIVAAALIVTGTILIGCVMTQNRWDLSVLRSASIEGKTVNIGEGFDGITILASTENIVLLPSEDGECRVIFEDPIVRNPAAAVQDGSLIVQTVSPKNLKEWIDDVQFLSAGTPQIIVYLPDEKYGPISIIESTGDIHIEKLSASDLDMNLTTGKVFIHSVECDGNVNLNVSTGDAELSYISCNNLTSKGTTGNITCKQVTARKDISIDRDTGDVDLDRCDAGNLTISTSTGDVYGTLLSSKIFVANTATGKVKIPDTKKGGNCTVTTSTGDIRLDIK